MAHRRAAWDGLGGLAADVALVQEAGRPGPRVALAVATDDTDSWETAGLGGSLPWWTAVARLCDRVELRPRTTLTLEAATSADYWVVSRGGSISAADVVTDGDIAFTAVSVYAA